MHRRFRLESALLARSFTDCRTCWVLAASDGLYMNAALSELPCLVRVHSSSRYAAGTLQAFRFILFFLTGLGKAYDDEFALKGQA